MTRWTPANFSVLVHTCQCLWKSYLLRLVVTSHNRAQRDGKSEATFAQAGRL